MTQTTLTIVINPQTKKARFFYNKQLAFREDVAVRLEGLQSTDSPDLYLIKNETAVAAQDTWVWDTDHFKADLELNTTELLAQFLNAGDQSLKSFTICVFESGVLYLNDLIDIMNNPASEGLIEPLAAKISFPGLIKGTDTVANIQALTDMVANDLWIASDASGTGLAGDGYVYTGTIWINIGPLRGPIGENLRPMGSDTYTHIISIVSPTTGDIWASTTDDVGAGVVIGDGIAYDGSAWVNQGTFFGPTGPTGPTGPIGPTGTDLVWDTTQTFALGQFCTYGGVLFRSLQTANLNKNPSSEPTWWENYSPTRTEWNQNGFPNRTDSTLAMTDATRTFSIQPVVTNFDYYMEGLKYTTTGDTLVISDVEGIHVLYYDGATLSETVNPTSTEISVVIYTKTICCIIYWSKGATASTGEALYVGEERHGMSMSPSTHSYLHFTVGMQYRSGLGLNTFSGSTGGATADAQFGVDSGGVYDEDIFIHSAAIASTVGLPIYHIEGTAWKKTVNAGFSVRTFDNTSSTRLAYNNMTGTPALAEVPNRDFVLYHVFATSEKDKPMIVMMGQEVYANRSLARAGAETEIHNLIINNTLSPEIRAIATIIFQTRTTGSYANAVNAVCYTTDDGDAYIDWRDQAVSRTSISTNDHNALAGLQGGSAGEYYHLTSAEYAALGGGGGGMSANKLTARNLYGGI